MWLKNAWSDKSRIESNIIRLEELKRSIHDLSFFVVSSQSGGYKMLRDLLENKLVQSRTFVKQKLTEALDGENNQKVALDNPMKFQNIMLEAEVLVDKEIGKERQELRILQDEPGRR